MEVSKQKFISVQLSYKQTKEILEAYIRKEMPWELADFKVEDYDPDCTRSGGEKGAFFLFLKEEDKEVIDPVPPTKGCPCS